MSHVNDSGQTVRRLPAYAVRAIITILALTVGVPSVRTYDGARAVEDLGSDGLWGRARLIFEREIK